LKYTVAQAWDSGGAVSPGAEDKEEKLAYWAYDRNNYYNLGTGYIYFKSSNYAGNSSFIWKYPIVPATAYGGWVAISYPADQTTVLKLHLRVLVAPDSDVSKFTYGIFNGFEGQYYNNGYYSAITHDPLNGVMEMAYVTSSAYASTHLIDTTYFNTTTNRTQLRTQVGPSYTLGTNMPSGYDMMKLDMWVTWIVVVDSSNNYSQSCMMTCSINDGIPMTSLPVTDDTIHPRDYWFPFISWDPLASNDYIRLSTVKAECLQ
jgi:hypothetical protein